MKQLPDKHSWLYKEAGPKMLVEALSHYGTLEHAGSGSNVDIIGWAREMGVAGWYLDDDIPWCGLFMGICAKRSGYVPPKDSLRARSWVTFGKRVPRGQEQLGHILIFARNGGGHVTLYTGENSHAFLCYGGNQSNAVGFAGIEKQRLITAVEPIWKIGKPANMRKIILSDNFNLSYNEN